MREGRPAFGSSVVSKRLRRTNITKPKKSVDHHATSPSRCAGPLSRSSVLGPFGGRRCVTGSPWALVRSKSKIYGPSSVSRTRRSLHESWAPHLWGVHARALECHLAADHAANLGRQFVSDGQRRVRTNGKRSKSANTSVGVGWNHGSPGDTGLRAEVGGHRFRNTASFPHVCAGHRDGPCRLHRRSGLESSGDHADSRCCAQTWPLADGDRGHAQIHVGLGNMDDSSWSGHRGGRPAARGVHVFARQVYLFTQPFDYTISRL